MAGKGNPENPWTWAAGGISLKSAGTVTPPAHGDITGDAPSAKDPDQLIGSLTFQLGTPPLAPVAYSHPQPGKGDIDTDNQFNPGSKAIPETWASGGPALTPTAVARNPGRGDLGDEYQPGEPAGIGQVSGGITWSSGGAALVAGPTTHNPGHGDIMGDYGKTELWQEIATWAAGNPPLAPGQLAATGPKGDFTDPNTWQDVVLYRTSQLYPLYVLEHMQITGLPPLSAYYPYTEHIQFVSSLGSGNYYLALVVYSNWPTEHMQLTGIAPTGSLNTGPANHFYNNWPAEHMQLSAPAPSGNFYLALITYSNWPAEHMQFTAAFSGGTLS